MLYAHPNIVLLVSLAVDWSIVIGLLGASAAIGMVIVNGMRTKLDRRAVRLTVAGERAIQMIESYHDGLLGVNSDGKVIVANQRARFITGYSEAEIVGMHINDFLPPRLRKTHSFEMKKYMRDPRMRLMGRTGRKLLLLTKRGEETHVLLSLTPREPIDNGPEVTVGMRVFDEASPVASQEEAHEA